MANPLQPQGTLNRLRGSINFTSVPSLNITAPFLGREMIGITFEGQANTPIETATGVVQSPEPYQRVTVNAHLLRTQFLANSWKAQLESNVLIGEFTIRSDSAILNPYQISNGAIQNVDPLRFNGTDAGWTIMISGIYYINSALWNF